MTDWKWAMVLILPLMWHVKTCPQPSALWQWQKARVWAVLMTASVATYWLTDAALYIALDLLAAMLVMMPKRGIPQRAIGGLFIIMGIMGAAFILSPTAGEQVLLSHYSIIGWIQWAILFLWGAHDTFGNYNRNLGASRHLRTDKPGGSG